MARFPDQPQPDEKKALASYIHLFARLYPWYVVLAIWVHADASRAVSFFKTPFG